MMGAVKALLNLVVMLGIGVFRILKGIIDVIVDAVVWVWNKIKAIISKIRSFNIFGGGGGGGSNLGNITPAPTGQAFTSAVNFTSNTTVNVSDKAEMSRMIDDNNKKVVDDLGRMVKQ